MKRVPAEILEMTLTPEAVDRCSEHVRAYLKSLGLPKRDVVRYAMSTEEILLKSLEAGQAGVPIRLSTGTRFFRSFVLLEIDGTPMNVYLDKEQAQTHFGTRILKNLGLSPEYSFSGGKNEYTFHLPKKKHSPIFSIIAALVLAFAVGFLGLLLPDAFRTGALDFFLTPLHNTFLNILGCIAGPMVFLSIAWGIYGIGDTATLKQVGKSVLFGYLKTVSLVVVFVTLLTMPLFSLTFAESSGSASAFSSILSMLLDIIPRNIFSPFVEGNTLQIIFLGIVIGISLLFLGRRTNAVAIAVEQINYLVQFLIEFISRLVPSFIFIVLVRMIWSDSLSSLSGVGKFFAVLFASVLAMALVLILITALRSRTHPLTLLRKGIPTLLIALSTASSAASFGTNMKACRKLYGIDETVASFGVPLGMVVFKPTTAVSYVTIALFFAEAYHVSVSPAWIILLIFCCIALALATPPIPGGAMTAYTVLFLQLGIPAEALAIALACDTFVDFVTTGGDQFLLPLPLLTEAGKLGMLDRDVLHGRTK